jgi:hypothetical protein
VNPILRQVLLSQPPRWDLLDAATKPQVYFNFNRSSTLTFSGGNITSIANLGTLPDGSAALGANGPTLGTVNSARCGTFDGTQWLRQTHTANWDTGVGYVTNTTNTYTFALLARRTGTPNGRILGSATENYTFGWYGGQTRNWYPGNTDNFIYSGSSLGGVTDTNWYCYVGIANGNSSTFWENGAQIGGVVTITQGPAALELNGYSGGAELSSCQIFAAALFKTAIDTATRQKVEGALLWEAGLQSKLPATHPYFGRPPAK